MLLKYIWFPKNISVSKIILSLPFFHIIIVSAYLYFYSMGFGGSIGSFFSIDDVFSTSVFTFAPIYLVSIIVPTLMVVLANTIKKIDNRKSAKDVTEYSSRRRDINLKIEKIIIVLFCIIYSYRIIFKALSDYLNADPISFSSLGMIFLLFMLLSFAPYVLKVARRFYFNIFLGLAFIVTVFSMGVTKGQIDRLEQYEYFVSRAKCGDKYIINKISDYYLSVDANSNRFLIKEDCNVFVTFSDVNKRGYLKWSIFPIVLYDYDPKWFLSDRFK